MAFVWSRGQKRVGIQQYDFQNLFQVATILDGIYLLHFVSQCVRTFWRQSSSFVDFAQSIILFCAATILNGIYLLDFVVQCTGSFQRHSCFIGWRIIRVRLISMDIIFFTSSFTLLSVMPYAFQQTELS